MISILLDSSNTNLSVGIAQDNILLGYVSYEAWQRQSEYMIPELNNLLSKYAIDKNDIDNAIYELANSIRTKLNCEDVSVYDDLSLVCVVGRGMKSKTGMSGQIFSLLGQNNINIKTISQGADEISIIVGIEEKSFTDTISAIYKEFIA